MKRFKLFLHLWYICGPTIAFDFWLLRCPRCHTRHAWRMRCIQ